MDTMDAPFFHNIKTLQNQDIKKKSSLMNIQSCITPLYKSWTSVQIKSLQIFNMKLQRA